MRVLAIESSAMVAGAAVINEERLMGEVTLNHRKTHSQKLMPLIEELLDSLELTLMDMDALAVSKGPGSFTGLRIGIATVKALAQATGKPVIGVSTLDGLAYNLACSGGVICPIMDARREQVYTSIYRWSFVNRESTNSRSSGSGKLERLDDYMAVPILELLKKLKDINEPVIFNGDGVPVYKQIILDNLGEQAIFAPAPAAIQRAASIAALALDKANKGQMESYNELVPFYLRKSQAEQKFGCTEEGEA